MITLNKHNGNDILFIKVSGKLQKKDYDFFSEYVENMIQRHGKIRILLEMEEFHGWSAGALWEDIKFDLKHFRHIDRLAIVGNKKWEHGMAVFCKPFTTAAIRYFDEAEKDAAVLWIKEGKGKLSAVL